MAKEYMYDHNSILIVGVLFVLILAAEEGGFRIGRRYQRKTNSDVKVQTNTIQAGTLGLLALLLGFTFNMSVQRYETRTKAVIKEASTISTALMRSYLLPAPYDSLTHGLLQRYIDLRIAANTTDYETSNEKQAIADSTREMHRTLWEHAVQAVRLDPNLATTGLFVSSLNEMLDAESDQKALLAMHVPEPILFLLFFVFIMSGSLVGYASGLGHRRAFLPIVLMTFLICLVVFIIIDLDRPKQGLINVDQSSMMRLKLD